MDVQQLSQILPKVGPHKRGYPDWQASFWELPLLVS
jgi:hypothetical protein